MPRKKPNTNRSRAGFLGCSQAFWVGFLRGLSGPGVLFIEPKRRDYGDKVSVSHAWKQVGWYMNCAIENERSHVIATQRVGRREEIRQIN